MDRLKILDVGWCCLFSLLLAPILSLAACSSSRQSTVPDSSISMQAVPPLVAATLAGDTDTVERLLEDGADPNVVHNTNTALTYVARDGLTEVVQLLIDYDADVNWIDGEGVTPLILASFKDNVEIVQLLLEHGADITIKDQWNRTALDYALRRGEADAIVYLLRAHL